MVDPAGHWEDAGDGVPVSNLVFRVSIVWGIAVFLAFRGSLRLLARGEREAVPFFCA